MKADIITPQLKRSALAKILLAFGLLASSITAFLVLSGTFDKILQPLPDTVSVAIILTSILICCRHWLHSGGTQPSASGVAALSFAIFSLLPVVYAAVASPLSIVEVRIALTSSLLAVSLVTLGSMVPVARFRLVDPMVRANVGVRTALPLLVMLGAFAFFAEFIPWGSSFRGAAVIFAVGLAALTSSVRLRQKRLKSAAFYLLTAALLLTYWFFFLFTGFGRINLASLLLLIGILVIAPKLRNFKLWVIAVIPIGLVWGGLVREGAESWVAVILEGRHMTSAFAPFTSWVRSVDSELNQVFGIYDFLNQVVLSAGGVLIPSDIWTNKPRGFGSLLAYELSPAYAPSGHSDVAGIFGEHWMYFGASGIFVALLLVAIHLFAISWLLRCNNHHKSVLGWPRAVVGAWSIAQIFSLMWTGPFTYWARMWPVIIVGTLAYLILLVVTRRAVSAASETFRSIG